MSTNTRYQQSELPAKDLARIGLTEDAMSTLPEAVKSSLLAGQQTPIIVAKVQTSDGRTVSAPVCLQVLEGRNANETRLLVFPIRQEVKDNLGVTSYELDRLKRGEIISKDIELAGMKQTRLIQLNPQTNTLMHCNPQQLQLQEKLRSIESIKDIQLGTNQKDALLAGQPVELEVGDTKVAVGVDLREPNGFKVVNGQLDEWQRLQREKYDIAHPEFMGFVQTDKNRWEYQQVVDKDSHKNEINRNTSQSIKL